MLLKQILLGLGVCAGLAAAGEPDATPMTVNNAEYERHCGADSDANYPCFTFVGDDLKDLRAQMYGDGAASGINDPTTNFLVKDDQMRDKYFTLLTEMAYFTTTDPNKSFSIYWFAFDVSVLYEPVDTSKACYRIKINSIGNGRIWVNDGLNNGEDIDLDSSESSVGVHEFCSKWLRLHVGDDK